MPFAKLKNKALLLALFVYAVLYCMDVRANSLDELLQEAEFIRSSNIPRFVSLLEQIDDRQADMTPYQKGLYAYLSAYNKTIKGQYQESLRISEQLFSSTNFAELQYRSAQLMVITHSILRDFYSAALYVSKFDELSVDVGNKRVLNVGQITKGLFYQELKQYDLAIEAVSLLENEVLSPRSKCIVQGLLVESSFKSGNDVKSIPYTEGAERLCESIGEIIPGSFVSIIKSQMLVGEGNVSSGLQALDRIESQVLNTKYPRLIAQYYATRAANLFALNDMISASINAKRTITYSEKSTFNKPAVEAYLLLSKIEKQQGNFEKALDYHEKYIVAEQAFNNEQKLNLLAFQRAQFESEISAQKLELVQKENQLLASEAETAKQEAKSSIVLAAFSSVTLVLVFMWLYRTNLVKQKFKALAEVDGLTGINNRRQFYNDAQAAIQFCGKNNQAVSLIIMDLDHFKSINDTYGHDAGDIVLKLVAETLQTECRTNDIIGRLGGEEFGIVLPGCNGQKAKNIADDLRRKIATIDCTSTGHEFLITASFGIAESSTSQSTYEQLFTQADKALYRSKDEGRNCVYLSTATA